MIQKLAYGMLWLMLMVKNSITHNGRVYGKYHRIILLKTLNMVINPTIGLTRQMGRQHHHHHCTTIFNRLLAEVILYILNSLMGSELSGNDPKYRSNYSNINSQSMPRGLDVNMYIFKDYVTLTY